MTSDNQIKIRHACELVFDAAAWHVGFAPYGMAARIKRRFTCAPGDNVFLADDVNELPRDNRRNIVCIACVKYSGQGFAGDRRVITGSHLSYDVVPDGYRIVAVVVRPD